LKDHLLSIKEDKLSRKDFLKIGAAVLVGGIATSFLGCKESSQAAATPIAQYANIAADPSSKVYHTKTCKLAPKTSKAVYFDSPVAAQNSGYRPCTVCHPDSP
jgi:hypothetical protein